MVNSYEQYYLEQAGSGLTVYQGVPYQRGHGFFGTLFSTLIKPLGKYLGRQALDTGVRVGSDLLSGKSSMKEALKNNFKLTGKKILDDGYERAKKYAQTGQGRRRRKRRLNKTKKLTKAKRNKRKNKKKTLSVKKSVSVKKRKSKKKRQKKSRKIDKFDLF